jgi:flagellum-specific ATP synthase
MPSVTAPEHYRKIRALRLLLAAYTRSEDLIRIGAYQSGSDASLDRAIAIRPAIVQFLQQSPTDRSSLEDNIQQLMALPE